MEGIVNPKWYPLPDKTVSTVVLTLDAPDDVSCLNEELCRLIDVPNEEQKYETINAGLSGFTGWKFFNEHTDHLLSWFGTVVKNFNLPIC